MDNPSEADLLSLCEKLNIDRAFFAQCIQESIVEIHVIEGHADLRNCTLLRLRRVQRLCHALTVEPPVAALMLEMMDRLETTERELRTLKRDR